ncbi:MAG TPA: hypothetical protein VEF04_07985 [Blastocatellia bacterium]|nr:hypothetical protein [Blastocatellia bacterium]
MKEEMIHEPARLLFHLNGCTKVLLERTERVGMADGGIVWEIPTEIIPAHLRKIGSRFVVRYQPLSPEGMNDAGAIREAKDRIEVLELNSE